MWKNLGGGGEVDMCHTLEIKICFIFHGVGGEFLF